MSSNLSSGVAVALTMTTTTAASGTTDVKFPMYLLINYDARPCLARDQWRRMVAAFPDRHSAVDALYNAHGTHVLTYNRFEMCASPFRVELYADLESLVAATPEQVLGYSAESLFLARPKAHDELQEQLAKFKAARDAYVQRRFPPHLQTLSEPFQDFQDVMANVDVVGHHNTLAARRAVSQTMRPVTPTLKLQELHTAFPSASGTADRVASAPGRDEGREPFQDLQDADGQQHVKT